MKRNAFGHFVELNPRPPNPKFSEWRYLQHDDFSNPKQFWTEHRQKLVHGTKPIKHTWSESDTKINRVLNNIAGAAHACNIRKSRWVRQCFGTAEDCCRFLEYLHRYKEHVNSYWYYALLNIAGVEERLACDSMQLATALYEQAIRTKQLPEQSSSTVRLSPTSPEVPLRAAEG